MVVYVEGANGSMEVIYRCAISSVDPHEQDCFEFLIAAVVLKQPHAYTMAHEQHCNSFLVRILNISLTLFDSPYAFCMVPAREKLSWPFQISRAKIVFQIVFAMLMILTTVFFVNEVVPQLAECKVFRVSDCKVTITMLLFTYMVLIRECSTSSPKSQMFGVVPGRSSSQV